ncbi:hypothetical protein LOD99_11779 [Oopsacas minuta]|uniref:Uncharacterized protein n=1 Tax=Oopsacas minuta TaxID=111878 RepID=A0AAV7JLN3_9METZ|nr:hypothetical protein LOD99_11779 [Oopsacas minuta]
MIESKGMEKMSTTFELFRSRNFQMKEIIKDISEDTLARFQCHPTHLKGSERVFYVTNRNNQVIKEMTPYIGKEDYEYFSKDYFFGNYKLIQQDKKPRITGLAPKECHPLINYCSGYFNHPDIIWGKLNKESQILLLVSQLRDPNNTKRSTWSKLLKNIKKEMKVSSRKIQIFHQQQSERWLTTKLNYSKL